MQQGAQAFAGLRVEGGLERVGPRGPLDQRGHPSPVKRLDGIAHRLVGATQGMRDGRGSLASGAGEDDLAAA